MHAWSVDWIRQVKERDDVVFEPRDVDGEVKKLTAQACYRNPDELLKIVERYASAGKRVGVLATCGYMLDGVKHALRAAGLPFHNPWRETRGDWNPLAKSGERLSAYLRPCCDVWGNQADAWTGPMLHRFADTVHVDGVFRRGAKAKIKAELKDIGRPLYTELLELFEPGVFEEIMNRCETSAAAACDWLMQHAINEQMRSRLAYPVRCVERNPRALFEEPRIVLGTGHSVKGADSLDVVVLIPDLSSEGDREWRAGGHRRDSCIRLAYVMATRARETLLLARSSGENALWT